MWIPWKKTFVQKSFKRMDHSGLFIFFISYCGNSFPFITSSAQDNLVDGSLARITVLRGKGPANVSERDNFAFSA